MPKSKQKGRQDTKTNKTRKKDLRFINHMFYTTRRLFSAVGPRQCFIRFDIIRQALHRRGRFTMPAWNDGLVSEKRRIKSQISKKPYRVSWSLWAF